MSQARANRVIEQARTHRGYRARAQKVNIYGARYHMDGQTWAGAFIETVMRESGELTQPSFLSSTAALAEYIRLNRVFNRPKPGDIAFFSFSTDGSFVQPHVGLVTDTEKFKSTGAFRVIEGQTASGLPRGPQEADGVYERTRFATDVLAFARPKYGERKSVEPSDSLPAVRPSQFQAGKTSKATVLLQSALHSVQGTVGFDRGRFDLHTASAVAQFQRHIGYHGEHADGQPDETTLRRLALESRFAFFRVRAD